MKEQCNNVNVVEGEVNNKLLNRLGFSRPPVKFFINTGFVFQRHNVMLRLFLLYCEAFL